MKYVCTECGTVFDAIPRVYRGFSGDHFGGSETMLPGCTHCGKYDFSQYTDDGYREILTLREQVKVLREALEASVDLLSKLENIGGFIGLAVISNGQTVLEQTKPKDGE